jgi:hypothetical protein
MTDIDREQLNELLSAYLDGELGAEEVQLVERVIREDEEARRLHDELRRTAALVTSLPRHRAPRSIAEDLRSQLERSELLDGMEKSRSVPGERRWPVAGRFAMAAMLAFFVLSALWVMVERYQPDTGIDGGSVILAQREQEETPAERLESPGTRATKETVPQPQSQARKRAAGRGGKGPSAERGGRRGVVTGQEGFGAQPTSVTAESIPETTKRVLNVGQKLAAGATAASLRDHPFASEPVYLQVRVRDEAQRDQVRARLLADLAKHRVSELTEYESVGEDARFYHSGRPGVNFWDAGEQQILVRAPARQIGALIDELPRGDVAADGVTLTIESVPYRGADQAREALLRQLGPRDVEDVYAAPHIPSESPRDGLFADWEKLLGSDPRRLAVAPEAGPAQAEEESKKRPAQASPGRAPAETESSADESITRVAESERPAAKGPEPRGRAEDMAAASSGAAEAKPAPKDAEKDAGGLPPPPSLVKRRLQELERWRDVAKKAETAEAMERPVTVVVRVVVDRPKNSATTGRPELETKAKAKRPSPKRPRSKVEKDKQ